MKKLLLVLSTFALVLSTTFINVTANENTYVNSSDPFEIKNATAKEKLDDYLNSKALRRGNVITDELELDEPELNTNNVSSFDEIIKVADGNNDLEYLYSHQDHNTTDIIAYDKTDDAYILLEEDLVNNTATLTINNDTYLFSENEESKLSLISRDGNELVFYEEILDEDYPMPLLPAEGTEVKEVDGEHPTTRATWNLYGGPLHKTSKMTFKVLELIGMVASGASLLVSGPLGTVVFIYTVAVSVGSSIKPTVHIKYYQYGASDCPSYIREQKYYYGAYSELSRTWYEQIKNQNGSAKVTYSYFHSVRPDYTGNSACMRY